MYVRLSFKYSISYSNFADGFRNGFPVYAHKGVGSMTSHHWFGANSLTEAGKGSLSVGLTSFKNTLRATMASSLRSSAVT